jgi:diguanylate cyclase (GGDEF)-like protein/PAS domain S-box-containing protein
MASARQGEILDWHDEFRALFESAPDLMFAHEFDGVLLRVNRTFERVTGYSRDEVVGRNVFDFVAPEQRQQARESMLAHLGGAEPSPLPVLFTTKNGEPLQLELTLDLLFRNGQPAAVQAFARDMTKEVAFTRYLQLLHRLSVTKYENLDQLLAAYLSAGCEIFAASCGAVTAANNLPLSSFGDASEDTRAAEVAASRQTMLSSSPLYVGASILVDDTVHAVISFWSNVDVPALDPHAREIIELMAKSIAAAMHQRQLTDQLAFQANHDALTGLPNRLQLQRELDASLERALLENRLLAVVFIDLDRFKHINDTLGHEIGDMVLCQIGERLQAPMRPGDTLARMGGDEFTAILTDCPSAEAVADYARELMAAVRTPCKVNGRELFVTASVGISLFPRDGADAATLLRHADTAMYAAKYGASNDLQFFTPDATAHVRRRLEIETKLRRALERGQLEVHFQPQVDLDGNLASLEALLVWDNPDLGRVSPAEFIPIAEDTGMILSIGAWVLQRVCSQITEWRDAGLLPPPVAVNVSALQFAQPDFIETVAGALRRSNTPASALELELTESLVMRDQPASAKIMQELRDLGVKIAIDDFGTGYSSLSYLRRLPADVLKIDQSFVRESEFGPATLALLKAIVALGHATGLIVTAEGIETQEQLDLIREAGCDRAQGHMFGAPLPKEAIEQLLR